MSVDAVESFLEAPKECYKETEDFINRIEDYALQKILSFEKQLKNSNYSDGELKVQNISFCSKRTENKTADIMAKNLIYYYEGEWRELKREVEKKAQGYHGESLNNVDQNSNEKLRVIKKVCTYIESQDEDHLEEWVAKNMGGKYCPYESEKFGDENGIIFNFIPYSKANKISHNQHFLKPLINRYTNTSPDQGKFNKQNFNGVLLHELNHAFVDNYGGTRFFYTENEFLVALNEIFAKYTNYIVYGHEYETKGNYNNAELIQWGVEILIEKNKVLEKRGAKKTGIDFLRDVTKRVTTKEEPLKSFIKSCLLPKDFKRIKKAEKTLAELEEPKTNLEESIEKEKSKTSDTVQKWTLESIEDLIKDIPGRNISQEVLTHLKREIKYQNNTGKIRKHDGATELNEFITKHLMKDSEKIEEVEAGIKEEKQKIKSQKLKQRINKFLKLLDQQRKTLNQIINS